MNDCRDIQKQEHLSSCGDLITKVPSREFPEGCLETSKGNTTEKQIITLFLNSFSNCLQ